MAHEVAAFAAQRQTSPSRAVEKSAQSLLVDVRRFNYLGSPVAELVCLAFKRFHTNPRMTPNATSTAQPRTASSISLAGTGAVCRN